MDLVIDANIIFAALIKESVTYHLLCLNNFHLFTPEFILTEIEKHKQEILQKTERSYEDFEEVLEILKRRMSIVSLDELVPYIPEATKICPDPGDIVYFALALKLNCAIWSNDRALKEKQDTIKVYTTNDLVHL